MVVLKDAASAAIYGSRSAGGVILVTTRRGKRGKPVFDYSYSYGIDSRTKNVSQTNAVQTGELYNRINDINDPANWKWSQEELDHYKTVNGGWGYDQLDAVWRNPSTQSHNFSVSGGAEKVKYFSSLSYLEQKGFLEPLEYKKMNLRLNATVDLTKDVEFFAGMGLTLNDNADMTFENPTSLYQKLNRWQPDQPVFSDGGQYVDYGWLTNVGGETKGAGGYTKKKFLKPQMVFNLTYKLPFLKGLSAKAAYSSNWAVDMTRDFRKNYELVSLKKTGDNHHIIHTDDESIVSRRKTNHNGKEYLKRTVNYGQDYQVNLQLTYSNIFNKVHNVQGALVFEHSQSNGWGVYGQREGFPVYLTDQFWAASSARVDTDGGGATDWENGRVSYVGQFNYAYASKYLASFSFREDGSMNFAPDERWGFFPAGSLGWVISEENFFNKSVVNNLKVRASVGLTGNDNVGGWQWQESYKEGGKAYFGKTPNPHVGITYGSVVNPHLTWEKTLSYNFGVDALFLDNWSATLDYWYKNTYDILGGRTASVPTSVSLSLPSENYGKVHAQGFDLNVGYRNRTGDFEYYANLALSYGWNKVKVQDYAENVKWIDIPVGKSRSMIKGYRAGGIIRTQAELDQFKKDNPNYTINGESPDVGMLYYKDLSGPDGKPDGLIDDWDRDIITAKNFPIVYGLNIGANWKGLSIDMMLSGRLNEKKSFKDLADGVEWNRMWSEWYDNSWTPDNTNAWLPKRRSANVSKTYTHDSDFWIKDASFLRLKYLNVAYRIPTKLYSKVFDQVKVFCSGTNLFLLSNFSYYDPEIGGGWDYPITRTVSFGVNVKF